ncbi:XRE family transcriptional regulator [Sphingomonas sp. CFBP 8765]|uniref:XRE family transcriptional regulator n=1 Tax=Sphingomonas sp. CFBP 8765 TaxID=2775274 RepID=UPI00177AB7FB|nr:S24 family peptidase [Sphingomonas sp. CFBP 8765]MBD8469180.1 helix-turn-helix transcriptional regulator [Sphingomonas sp. CFBP 8765]
MTLGERVSARMKMLGLSQSELARRVGLSQPAIYALINRNKTGSKSLHEIARELRTTTAYLTGETDDASEGALPAPTESEVAAHLDLVPIAMVDMAYGMGATFADGQIGVEMVHFPKAWVDQLTHSAATHLAWARGKGDSMAPTINDNDMVLIDRSERRVGDQDLIWAFTIGDMAMIKRLRIRGDKVIIMSDSSEVSDDSAHPDEINIIGRITRVVKRV